MHILFEALNKKKGMTLGELIANVEKAKNLADEHTNLDQPVKARLNFNGSIQHIEIEA